MSSHGYGGRWPDVRRDVIDEAVRQQVRANAEVIERVCEAALQSGVYGVLVKHLPGGTVSAELSADVPYGTIHEHQEADRG